MREQIRKGNNRIAELEHQQQKLAQEVARLEKIEFSIRNFERAKVQAIERKVNSMFEITHLRCKTLFLFTCLSETAMKNNLLTRYQQ